MISLETAKEILAAAGFGGTGIPRMVRRGIPGLMSWERNSLRKRCRLWTCWMRAISESFQGIQIFLQPRILLLWYGQTAAIVHKNRSTVKCGHCVAIDKKTAVDPEKIIRHQLFHQKKRIRNVDRQIPADNPRIDIIRFDVENICRRELVSMRGAIGKGHESIRSSRHKISFSAKAYQGATGDEELKGKQHRP